jgi:type IV pilus assembly protein PilB
MKQASTIPIEDHAIQLLSSELANQFRVIPMAIEGRLIKALTDDPSLSSRNELEVFTGYSFEYQVEDAELINDLLTTYYSYTSSHSLKKIDRNDEGFIDDLIEETIKYNGSDIHFEVYEEEARIRIRVDGHLVERYSIPRDHYQEMINKVKIVSRLDIAEKRLPQDGRINFQKNGHQLDIRVNTLPTHYGEKAVLRLLGKNAGNLSINRLGMDEGDLALYQSILTQPNGMVLISGPTGSGKTTTLYATLKTLNSKDVNILTIEDPVEYTLLGINQVQLNEKIGLTFGSAMRSFLRQDPDIIMVGEIRDGDTAMMATRAALTGHLVFSTIHTNSAFGIISRLVEMGIAPYLVSETLNAGIAQRLVRILCPNCKTNVSKHLPILDQLGVSNDKVYEPHGCSSCLGTGYKGRRAIYEILPGGPDLKRLMDLSKSEVDQYMKENNFPTLKDSAIKLLINGETSIDELVPFLV